MTFQLTHLLNLQLPCIPSCYCELWPLHEDLFSSWLIKWSTVISEGKPYGSSAQWIIDELGERIWCAASCCQDQVLWICDGIPITFREQGFKCGKGLQCLNNLVNTFSFPVSLSSLDDIWCHPLSKDVHVDRLLQYWNPKKFIIDRLKHRKLGFWF